ncbi:hypothetical protein AAMO2058_000656900 [Amorphochlora amoebiformis]
MAATDKPEGQKGAISATLWILVYMGVSSMMLIVNKLAIYLIKAPSTILLAQLSSTALAVKLGSFMGVIALDEISKAHLKPFSIVAAAFLSTIFCNIKTLQYANVETFIVFRACTPLALCVLDYIFLGRQLPNQRSVLCLLGLFGGALGYVYSDKSFEVKGYFWVCVWFLVFLFDMIFLKHAADTVPVKSNWTRVFYSNMLPCFPLLFLGVGTNEAEAIVWSLKGGLILVLSCVMGLAMSYVSWKARSLISSTAFSIVGNCCKLLTIVVNCLIWDHHASSTGIACLCICLFAAYFYQQAPMREDTSAKKTMIDDPESLALEQRSRKK